MLYYIREIRGERFSEFFENIPEINGEKCEDFEMNRIKRDRWNENCDLEKLIMVKHHLPLKKNLSMNVSILYLDNIIFVFKKEKKMLILTFIIYFTFYSLEKIWNLYRSKSTTSVLATIL